MVAWQAATRPALQAAAADIARKLRDKERKKASSQDFHRMVEALKHVFAIRMSLADPEFHPNVVRDAVRDLFRSEALETQLGRGSVDLPPLLAKLEEQHYNGYLTVQRPVGDRSRQELGESLEYLENVFG